MQLFEFQRLKEEAEISPSPIPFLACTVHNTSNSLQLKGTDSFPSCYVILEFARNIFRSTRSVCDFSGASFC